MKPKKEKYLLYRKDYDGHHADFYLLLEKNIVIFQRITSKTTPCQYPNAIKLIGESLGQIKYMGFRKIYDPNIQSDMLQEMSYSQ